MARTLAKLRSYHNSDLPTLDEILDALESVLDAHTDLSPADAPAVAERLHRAFRTVVHAASAPGSTVDGGALTRARRVLFSQEQCPKEPEAAVGYLRRLALATEELLTALEATYE
ncbi:DUF6415 family natural product biosynthesis protein [Streptomyces smyrnaeus]|uniref:Uncharacterized protein n=1 Tax=Streptomyces smyrnaeus TaxID=1387713 RepID=A0ABS3Y695_9ACTN|nr:DUF6415 family natural product biosynthesis protein [Streptomyces smyrnaeus]MBO8203180.1 hypothetical protein [Streptomyces smyrnaeus]